MLTYRASKEALARLRRRGANPQVKHMIGVFDPYRWPAEKIGPATSSSA